MTPNSPADDERIKSEAHRLWEEAGRPDGRDQEFWFAALQKLGSSDESSETSVPSAPGEQKDDNIDDLGRKPDGTTLDQPGAKAKK